MDPETSPQSRRLSAQECLSTSAKTRRSLCLFPFQERRMRSYAKIGNLQGFRSSFGKARDPFPTLLAGTVNVFANWPKGEVEKGNIRKLTPLECERLMGLPEDWTKYGFQNKEISPSARYKALGNAIVLPCAEFILGNVAKVYGKEDPV
nr:DNA cytosine methyltransferase [Lactobacillus sp. UCMA15818]